MNPVTKHYMRLRFQKRVAALKRAGIAVTHKNVYSEHVEVGVAVPRFGAAKRSGRRQYNYAESRTRFVIEFVVTGIVAVFRRLLHPRSKNVFSDHEAG
jgi:hypothetical protein